MVGHSPHLSQFTGTTHPAQYHPHAFTEPDNFYDHFIGGFLGDMWSGFSLDIFFLFTFVRFLDCPFASALSNRAIGSGHLPLDRITIYQASTIGAG